MAIATHPNLIRWYNPDPEISLPRPFADCRETLLVTYPGETTHFYMNLIDALPGGSNVGAISITREETGTNTVVTTQAIFTDALPTTVFRVYGTMACPLNLTAGVYRWRIVLGGTLYYSSRVEVMSEARAKLETIKVNYSNSTTLQGVRFPWITDNLTYLTARIPAVYVEPSTTTEDSNYTEVTTGQPTSYNTNAQKLLKFRLYCDELFFLGLTSMLRHDNILFNDIPVERFGNPERTASGRGSLAPTTFSVYDLSYSEPLVP